MADIQSNIRVNIDTNSAVASLKVLQGQISAFHQEMSRSGALAASEMSRLQNNFMNAVNRTGQFDARLKTIKTTTESFTDSLEKNKLSMGQYFRYAGAATKDFGKFFKGEFDTIEKVARERVKDLQTQYVKMGRDANGAMKAISIRPLVLDLDDLSTKTQIAAQKQQLLNQLLKQGSTNMLNWGKNTQWAGRQLMVGFTVPLTMLGQIAAKTFMEMEQSVLKFQRVYGDFSTTAQQTKEMTIEVTNLAKAFTKYGVAVSDTMGMAADAAAMGKQGADLLAQVESASKLAVLGGVDQKQALQTTISLTNAFGISADKLTGKINFLNAVENQTVTSIDDLTIAIPKAAPVIKQLGGNVEDLAFFLTAMKEGGIDAAEGANALKSGIASIINPTKKASDMLSSFGINIKGIVEANKGDVKGMVMGVAEALNTLDPLNRAKAIEQLFGKFQFARISTLFKNITDVNSQATKVAELAAQGPGAAAVLAQREMKKIEDSPMFKFKKALEDLKVELIPLGEQFMKAVTPIAKFLTDVLKNFNNMSSGTKDFIGGLTMTIAGIGPIALMVVGLIANGIANLIKLFAGFKSFINNLGKGTRDLGSQTNYMTQEQVEAAAVASSLDQAHSKLTQTFTAEAGAVANLRKEMERAVAIQGQFGWTPGGVAGKGKATKKTGKKMATGGVVQGPGGPKDDAVPTNLSNGEVVLSVDTVKKNPGIIAALLQGQKIKIPGYKNGSPRVGSGSQGKAGKSNFTVLRPYGANVSNQQGLESFGDLGGMADISSMYMPQIAKGAKTTISAISQEVDAWKAANKGLLDAAAEAVASGVPAAEAFADASEKFKKDMVDANGPVHKFTESAKKMYPQLEADLKEAQAYAKKHNLDVKNAGDVDKMRAALPDNMAARGLGTPGNFQAGMKARSAGVAMVTGAADMEKYGVPKTFVDSALSTKHPLYNQSSSQEHVGRTWAEVENRQSDREQRAANSGKAAPIKAPVAPVAESTQAGAAIASKVEQDVATATNVAAQAQSPSRKTMQAGKNLADGAVVGITEAGPAFKRSVEETAKSSFVISPASAQYAREQMHKMLKPFTDSSGLINMQKLEAAQGVRVHLITQEEKALNEASQMLMVADKLMHPFRATIQGIGDAATIAKEKVMQGAVGIKNFAIQAPGLIRNSMTVAVTALKSGVERMKVSIIELSTKLKTAAARIGKGVIGQLGSGKAMMTTAAVMGTMSMMPGKVGEIANAIMMPLMMIQSVIALIPETMMASIGAALLPLMGPILAIAAPLLILGGLIAFSIWQNAENNKKAAQFGNALAVSAESVKKFGEFTGRVGTTEALQAESDARRSGITAGQLETGQQYVESDQGKADVANLQYLKDQGSLSPAQVAQQYSATLAQAITQGTLTLTEANSIANAVGKQLGDSSFAITVNSQLTELLGPDGKDLLKNPLEITTKLVQANTENADFLMEGISYTQEDVTNAQQTAFDYAYQGQKNAKGEQVKPGETYVGTDGKTHTASTLENMESNRAAYIPKVGEIKSENVGSSEAKSAFTAMLGSYGTVQTTQDSGLQAIDDKIAQALADIEKEKDPTKKAGLQQQYDTLVANRDTDRQAIITSVNSQRDKLFNAAAGTGDDKGTFNTAVDEKYKDADETTKTLINTRKDDIKNVANDSLRQILEGGFLSETLGANDQSMITKMASGTGGEAFSNAYVSATKGVGDRQATELTGTLSAMGADTNATTKMLKNVAYDPKQFDGYIAALEEVRDLSQGDFSVKFDVNTQEGRAQIEEFSRDFTKISDAVRKNGGKMSVKVLQSVGFSSADAKKMWNDPAFKKMTSGQQKTYVAQYQSLMKFKGTSSMTGPLKAPFEEWLKKHKNGTQDQFIAYLAGKAATSGGSGAAPADTPSTPDGGGGGGGSTAPTKSDKANAALSIMGRQEEKINKAYDERMKALDKIQTANEKINQQKKDQLDLADALSRGDIGAAARAQQQARQNAQATALQEQRDQMGAARDAQLASLRVNGMSREQLQAFLDREANKADKKTLGSWHLATGGLVPKTQYFALGGKPKGTDTIAAMLTPGEFVVKKPAVDAIGHGNMQKINEGKLPASGHGSVYNYSISVNVKSDADADQIAKTVLAQIEKVENQGVKGNRA